MAQKFKETHKVKDNNFIRNRNLDFATTINIMLKKSGKSLQNTLNDSKEKFLKKYNFYSVLDFAYYFNSNIKYPEMKKTPIVREKFNWRKKVLNRDAVFIEINESAIPQIGFGFIEAALSGLVHDH